MYSIRMMALGLVVTGTFLSIQMVSNLQRKAKVARKAK